MLAQKGDPGVQGPAGEPGTTDASGLTSGTLSDARLSTNVALLTRSQSFMGSSTFDGLVLATNAANILGGQFFGDGSALTNLLPSSLNGVLATQQLPDLNASMIVSGNLSADRIADGSIIDSKIVGMSASKLTGAIPDSLLSTNIARTADLLAVSNAFQSALIATNNLLVTRFTSLIDALQTQVEVLSNSLITNIPAGVVVASVTEADPGLLAQGMKPVTSIGAASWLQGETTGELGPRFGHSGVWTGDELLIWGGTLTGGIRSQSGASYSPQSDGWTAVSPIGAPTARSGHTAIWTGSEMIVWGGFGDSGYLSSGGRYNNSTKTWQPITQVNAPAARIGHIAVWIGDRMLVWGGQSVTGLLNDGAIYDPTADSWTTLVLPTPPVARRHAKAVWTGTDLLLWGGEGAFGQLGDGARLSFDSGGVPLNWSSTSEDGAPTARSGHAVVWTGTRMLVWGGREGALQLADGAAYDITADTWTALNQIGSPSARADHNAVWTGNEMLIWGGESSSGAVANGAAYDVEKDSWRDLSDSGSPTARAEAVGVWTGSEFILYGGKAALDPLSALERLDPRTAWHLYTKQ